jgi:hypothetical protein
MCSDSSPEALYHPPISNNPLLFAQSAYKLIDFNSHIILQRSRSDFLYQLQINRPQAACALWKIFIMTSPIETFMRVVGKCGAVLVYVNTQESAMMKNK